MIVFKIIDRLGTLKTYKMDSSPPIARRLLECEKESVPMGFANSTVRTKRRGQLL
jgi:hypothetical protein